MSDDDYKVGKGRPPLETRFKEGHCPNPHGRPKGRVVKLPHEAALGQKLVVDDEHGSRVVTAEQAFLEHVSRHALATDASWSQALLALLANTRRARQASGAGRTIVFSVYAEVGDIGAIMRTAGMAALYDAYRPSASLVIEAWLVEAALARLGDRRLTVAEQEIVFASTRTPHKVKWPDWWTVNVADL